MKTLRMRSTDWIELADEACLPDGHRVTNLNAAVLVTARAAQAKN